jgi:polar amino acid transport system substrate-binding protein/cystine transport system substrate-binding protein
MGISIRYLNSEIWEEEMKSVSLLSRYLLLGVLIMLVVSCGGPAPAEESAEGAIPSEELVVPGKLTIATTGSADPFTIVNEDGDLVGYDIDACTALAEKLELEPDWVVIEWAGTLPGLKADRFDMVCSGVGLTPERLTSPDFNMTVPTIQGGGAIYVREGDDRFQSWEDLDGMVMGSVRGAWYGPWIVENQEGDIEFVEYPGETELFLDLENERLDFIAFGSLGAGRLTDAYDVQVVLEEFRPTPYGAAVRKEALTLLKEANTAFLEWRQSGQLSEWQTEWFGAPHLPGGE